jgi:hypothetical protein
MAGCATKDALTTKARPVLLRLLREPVSFRSNARSKLGYAPIRKPVGIPGILYLRR